MNLRRALLCPVLLAAVAGPSATATAASTARTCPSADLRYPYEEGLPKDFGVWRLKVTGGSCATAHAVAKAWQLRFEQSPTGKVPTSVRGFRFRQLPPNAAQTLRLRGTRGQTVVRFDYVVPNG